MPDTATREQAPAQLRLEGWRREIRDWLAANVTGDLPAPQDHESAEVYRGWERTLYGAGYGAIHWPAEYGGRDADPAARIVFQEEYERARAPQRINMQGLMLAGPTVMRYGTDRQRERWVPQILRGEHIWCQGFSEPDAGSDLASLRTRAEFVGDQLVINGQKIWTSGATYSDWMFALVRTNMAVPKHEGITWVMIDMTTPGIEVRPVRQIDHRSDFAEVFFTDVRVPVENVIGEIDDGWSVAMTALGFERGVGRRTYVSYLRDLKTLIGFVHAANRDDDQTLLEELGEMLGMALVYRDYVGRVVDEMGVGDKRTDSSMYNKLFWSEYQTRLYELGMRVLGDRAQFTSSELAIAGSRVWCQDYWYSRAARIFAGTNQIQRSIIAERVLGLPKGSKS